VIALALGTVALAACTGLWALAGTSGRPGSGTSPERLGADTSPEPTRSGAPPSTASAPAAGPTASAPAAGPTASTPAAGPTASVPLLGAALLGGVGYGEGSPTTISSGGDPTSMVEHIRWQSWGGAQAVGEGISTYLAPGGTVVDSRPEPVLVVAFQLGACPAARGPAHRPRYRAVEWFFPQHGQRFDPTRYRDACTGMLFPEPH
jgi:hypothetical protein